MRTHRLCLNVSRRMVVGVSLVVCLVAATAGLGWANGLENRVIERKLANGLTVLLVERHQAPILSINMTFGVGGINEQTGRTGVAHLYEHMAFKGTRTIGTQDFVREQPLLERMERLNATIVGLEHQIAEERLRLQARDGSSPSFPVLTQLEQDLAQAQQAFKDAQSQAADLVRTNEMPQLYQRHGAVGLNASTSKDVTRYVVSLPANRLPLWAAIEADRMAHPILREFFKERAVVMEERRLRTDDNPHGLLYEAFTAAAFQAHPYKFPTIGWASDILNLTPEDTREFFHTYYGPANAVVAIVGDINAEEVFQLVERHFGGIPRNGAPPRVVTEEPLQRGERRLEVEFDAEPVLLIGYHKPGIGHPDDFVFDAIDSILSEGVTSRLYRNLVREKRVAASVGTSASYPGAQAPNLFVISAVPLAPQTTQEVEAAIYEEIDKLKTEPVSKEELEKVLNNLDADLVRSLRSNSGLASQLTYFHTIAGDWRYILQARDRIAAVTPADIQRVARQYLVQSNRTVANLVKPRTNGEATGGHSAPSVRPKGDTP